MTRQPAVTILIWLILMISHKAAAEQTNQRMIDLPSGAQAYLQETIVDDLGDTGLTYRYRYVMPDLALRVPATTGPATDFDLQEIDTLPSGEGEFDGDYIDEGALNWEEFDFMPMISLPDDEAEADGVIDHTLFDQQNTTDAVLPAAPISSFKDPVHEDVIWLCQNHALPEALKQPRRPAQLIISLADQESEFGSYDPEILQLFEAFTLPENRNHCDWRPW